MESIFYRSVSVREGSVSWQRVWCFFQAGLEISLGERYSLRKAASKETKGEVDCLRSVLSFGGGKTRGRGVHFLVIYR